jgi:hypothetical protein
VELNRIGIFRIVNGIKVDAVLSGISLRVMSQRFSVFPKFLRLHVLVGALN